MLNEIKQTECMMTILIIVPWCGDKLLITFTLGLSNKRGSRGAAHAAISPRWSVMELLK